MKTRFCAISVVTVIFLAICPSYAFLYEANRNSWSDMQGDGPVVPQSAQPHAQTQHQVQPQYPVVPPQCEPPNMQAIGKRSVEGIDSFPNLNRFLLNEDSSDVHLVANGTRLPAHKFVLSAKSHKFAELFKSDPSKAEFDMGQVSESVLKEMLKYFYTETFHLEHENDYDRAIEVYRLANEYEVEGLKAQVERALARLISTDNYLDILKFAEDNQMLELIKLWNTFVFTNTQVIIADDKFANESNGIVIKVLSALNARGEYVISRFKKMMADDPSIKAEDLRGTVRLEKCSLEDLTVLGEMGLYDYKFLFEDMIKRYNALSISCQRPVYNRRLVSQPQWMANNRPIERSN